SQEYSSNRAGRYEEPSNRGEFSDFGSKNWENDENDMSNNINNNESSGDISVGRTLVFVRGGRRGGDNNFNSRLCFNCNEAGHQARDCTAFTKGRERGGTQEYNRGFSGDSGQIENTFNDHSESQSLKPRVQRYVPSPPPTAREDIFGTATQKGENFQKYHTANVKCSPEGVIVPIELYEEARLNTEVLSNIRNVHYDEPTAIQRYALPAICQGKDIMACAQTGSGKTAAFLLPIISNLLEYHKNELSELHDPPSPLCLILSPTRELAVQTDREARKFSFNTGLKSCLAIGGFDISASCDSYATGCHILSATAGRLIDIIKNGYVSLRNVKYFVLDEADRMLDTSFGPDMRELAQSGLPTKDNRQTSMWSATFPREIQNLAKGFLKDDYIFLAVGHASGANEDIIQTIELVQEADKKDRLIELLEEKFKKERCLIFVETKRQADYIGLLLSGKGLISTTMHGDRSQSQRMQAVRQFTTGQCPILVATSVAARGLDFPLIGYVVNYDLPSSGDFYVHRIGRTGRAGHVGKSISFFDPTRSSDRQIAPDLIERLREVGQEVPEFLQRQVAGATEFHRERRNFDNHSTDTRFPRNSNDASRSTTYAAGEADWK
ncbi:unnamed protein product, partial [Didymodactylos carnosus]